MWAVVWLAAPMLFAALPPSDNIEQLMWSQGLELGYHKHPPLPTWILIGAGQLFPLTPELTYALGVLSIAIGGIFVWRLSTALLRRQDALFVVLATACIGFYTYRSHLFNHNTVLVPVICAAAWVYYRALERGRLRDWLMLGVLCAAGMLTKYQFALMPLTFAFIAWRLGRLSDGCFWRGAGLAMAVAGVLLVPHMLWLWRTDFLPFQYASESVLVHLGPGQRLTMALGFLAQQLRFLLPALILLGVAMWVARRRAVAQPAGTTAAVSREARIWVLALGLMPLALMLLMGLVLGTKIRTHWGTTALQFAVLPVMVWLRSRNIALDKRTALAAFAVIQLMVLAYFAGTEASNARQRTSGGVHAFDPAAFAGAIERDWRRVTNEPLRYVASTTVIGGFAVLHLQPRPQLLIEGQAHNSPWVDMTRLASCGAVYVAPMQPPAGRAVALRGEYTSISYERKHRGELRTLSWSIVAPEPSCAQTSNVSASLVGGHS